MANGAWSCTYLCWFADGDANPRRHIHLYGYCIQWFAPECFSNIRIYDWRGQLCTHFRWWAVPNGTVGATYSTAFVANRVPAAITFSAVNVALLPPGLNLSAAGVHSGTPTATGTYTLGLTAWNGVNPDSRRITSLKIAEQLNPTRRSIHQWCDCSLRAGSSSMGRSPLLNPCFRLWAT